MKEKFSKGGIHTHYSHSCLIVDLSKVDADAFLSANDPLVALLSLISDTKPVQETLKNYVTRYQEQVKEQPDKFLPLMNYLLQLKLPYQQVTNLIMEVTRMLSIKKEDFVFYKQGKEEGLQEGLQKGLQKGLQEGLLKGIRITIIKQLNNRFKPSDEQEAEVKQLLEKIKELSVLEDVSVQVVQAQSLQEFMGYLRGRPNPE